MRGFISGLAVGMACLLFLAGCGAKEASQNSGLDISAASSLQKPLQEIKELYVREKPDEKLVFNFGSSGSLQRQIEQGAKADVFISAADKQMDRLQDKGLLAAGTRRELLGNQLALIVPKADTKIKDSSESNEFALLASRNLKSLAIGEPSSVPVGEYGIQVLTKYKLLNQLKGKLVFAKDAKEVLTWVETGNVDAGLVYQSDAIASKRVRVVALAPADTHKPIQYPVGVIKDSKIQPEAKDFIDFLSSSQAEEVFKKYGFIPLRS